MRKSNREILEFKKAERAWSSEPPSLADALPLQPSSLNVRSRRPISSLVIGTVVAAAALSAVVVLVLPVNPAALPAAPAEDVQAAPQTTASLSPPLSAEPAPAVPLPQPQTTEAALPAGNSSEPPAATMPQAVHQTAPAPAQEAHQTEPTPGASTDTPSAQPEQPAQAEMIQPLAAEDVATYLEKGEEKVAAGDLAAARLFFERVARSGDPRGALAMAKTFDPNVLSALPIIGGKADPEAARSWYERAKSMQASL